MLGGRSGWQGLPDSGVSFDSGKVNERAVVRRVVASAPVRVADVGGWTDTWFGGPGRVCHLAVGPGVRVEAALVRAAGRHTTSWDGGAGPVRIVAPDLGVDERCGPSSEEGWATPLPGRQPLLEHAVASVLEAHAPDEGCEVEVRVTSAVPAGASLGTSASVVVALVGALKALLGGAPPSPAVLAAWAHRVETERVGRESGVQDQWAAAFGGAGELEVDPFPQVTHQSIDLTPETVAELDARLVTVVFGVHDSSAVHREVIAALEEGGAAGRHQHALADLRALAGQAADALRTGDVDDWAEVLTEASEAQRRLHPSLVGAAHQAAIDVARRVGARGWKVNGAGGAGGSLTIVAATMPTRRAVSWRRS